MEYDILSGTTTDIDGHTAYVDTMFALDNYFFTRSVLSTIATIAESTAADKELKLRVAEKYDKLLTEQGALVPYKGNTAIGSGPRKFNMGSLQRRSRR